jgi:hypothetical protein
MNVAGTLRHAELFRAPKELGTTQRAGYGNAAQEASQMRDRRSPAAQICLALVSALLVWAGCGYSIRPPYSPKIKTVYVPVFKSVSFQRNLNLQLTELLIKEIQNRTPFKVVGSPEGADATLEGTISFVDRNLGVENPNNLPRQLMQMVMVNVRFIDNRTQDEKVKDLPPVAITDLAPFFPEIGETAQLGAYKAMQKMVEQIVGMMETPWEGAGLADDSVKAQ